ncbi:MAG: aminoglycoside phosphotransferase family protein [Actinomycetales bacterium]|nr:aminoglycoside phosphotransferase family protein [Actinomycetales bacterium]
MDDEEVPLVGGDVTEGLVRVGGTVRRPLGEQADRVHAVLRHLESVGFDGAPRFLGIDERGRETLTFVEGEVAGRPWPAWVGDDDRAVSVARLLRRLDDALVPLGLPAGASWPEPPPGAPGPHFLGHLDVTPENTVFRDGTAHALIDFDLVRPASRVDEVANLLIWWGAWMPAGDREAAMRAVDAAGRGRLLADAYGLDVGLRPHLVPTSILTAQRSWPRMKERAERLGGGWARMWDEGVGDRILRRERWLRENADALTDALVARAT